MTYIRSFSRVERELMHHYRDQLNHAESEEDVKKFFSRTARQLLNSILDDSITVEDDDVMLNSRQSPYFKVSSRLKNNASFKTTKQQSDLTAVLRRFAEPAVKHRQHLCDHPGKSETKIRHH